ncbi:unnamed protein product [Pleuronectes platessa]|uniref:Uncharacterized protein n=1 Tax=Pleuronectes platessa TaxID=8262 RepID=A0A9N7VSE9_PLEPL|nr:unnamed protein product [Pleuronectes platessa]
MEEGYKYKPNYLLHPLRAHEKQNKKRKNPLGEERREMDEMDILIIKDHYHLGCNLLCLLPSGCRSIRANTTRDSFLQSAILNIKHNGQSPPGG